MTADPEAGGAVSGAREIRLAIGAVTTAIVSVDPQLSLAVPAAVSRFVVGDRPADIRVEAAWTRTREPPAVSGPLLFDSGGLWQLREAGPRLVWTFTSKTFGTAPYKTAIFDRDFSAGSVLLHAPYFDPRLALYPLEYPLDELVLTNWLALGRGIEIHGCAVRDADGAGYLFAGHSGAGKSTIAGLWHRQPGVTVLSDDRVILRKLDDEIWMHGTPWHGDEPLGFPVATRLTEGFFLQHASRNGRAGVSRPEAVASLFARSFPPFYSAAGLDFSLAFLSEVSARAPFSELGVVPDDAIVDFVRGTR